MKTYLDEYVADEIARYKGVAMPEKASLLKRVFLHKIPCKRLHPNPNDDFCNPAVGPNYDIITKYEKDIENARTFGNKRYFDKALLVEKMYPDGYMLMNGHHRWGAAIRMGVPKLVVRVVNLTQASDIKEMLANAQHDKRVTFDLDEVVFVTDSSVPTEKGLPYPSNRVYKERLRLGVPALFYFLKKQGYDIWVYTANYYSLEYVKKLFKRYHVQLDGIVTGTARPHKGAESLESLIAEKYPQTLDIGVKSVVRIDAKSKAFDEHALSGDPATWSQEVMDIIGASDGHE